MTATAGRNCARRASYNGYNSYNDYMIGDKRKILLIIAGFFALFVGIVLVKSPVGNIMNKLGFLPKSSISPTPTVKPLRPPLPQGRQVYNVSRGNDSKGPDIRQVIIDPFDPKRGEVQKFWVKVESAKGVKSVTVILYADDNTVTQALKLVEGDANDGVWEGSTTTVNTHDFLYRLHVVAADEKDSARVELSFR